MAKTGRKRGWFFLIGAALLAGGVFLATAGAGFGSKAAPAIEGVAVQRGLLRISVVERGNLKAANSESLKCEVEGQTTIQTIPIKNGAEVQAGDVLCVLDTSQLELRKTQQGISVQNAEAAQVKSKQNYEIQQSQNDSDIDKAKRNLEFAELDLKKYLDGDKPQLLQQADEDILLKDEELKRGDQNLAWSEKLASRGFLEQTQLDADRLAKTRAEVSLNQARRSKELLLDYEIPRKVRELEAEVKEKQAELQRGELRARARIVDFESDLHTAEAKLQLERDEFAKIVSQIEKATLRAPVAGTVVFTVNEQSRWGGGSPIQEGAQVREGQEIMTIPSSDAFIAEASLHESVLEKVHEGMNAVITVDALQMSVPGIVRYKARQNDQNAWFANPDLRVYKTEIELSDVDPRMRPGMSCSLEIMVDDLPDELYVPVQCVFPDGGKHVAFVTSKGAVEKRSVEVGDNNGKWVAIASGLAEGETVLLAQPPGTTLAPPPEAPPNEFVPAGSGAPGAAGSPAAATTAARAPSEGRPEGGADGARSAEHGERRGEKHGEPVDAASAERRKKMMEELAKDPAKLEEFKKRMQEGHGPEHERSAEAAPAAAPAAPGATAASGAGGSR